MKLEVVNSGELLHLAREQSLFQNIVRQLEKDFLLANVVWDTPKNIDSEQLIAALREKIYYLIMERFQVFLNVLYVIDVPEKEFHDLAITDAVAVADQMAFLILKREYQKVWFRNRYGSR